MQTVLITDATNGVAYEISKIFARNKFRIIIVDREAATLHNVSEILKTLGASAVYHFCKDVTSERGVEELFIETENAGLNVDILVTESSTSSPGKFSDVPLSKDVHHINKSILSLVKLTKLYLKKMLHKNSGCLLQISPLITSENASLVVKSMHAFNITFTKLLKEELKFTGIKVVGELTPTASSSLLEKLKQQEEDDDNSALVASAYYDSLFTKQETGLAA